MAGITHMGSAPRECSAAALSCQELTPRHVPLAQQLREAVQWIAGCYEARANAHLGVGESGQHLTRAPRKAAN
jgi:hypothetical protein